MRKTLGKIVSQVSLIATKKALRKKTDDPELTANLRSAPQVTAIKPENIWDLITVHGFLEAICRYEPPDNELCRLCNVQTKK